MRSCGSACAELSAAEEGAAIERRKKISVASARLLVQLTLPGVHNGDRLTSFFVSWADVDINFADSDGQWLPAVLLTTLRKLHSNYDRLNNASSFVATLVGDPEIAKCQDAIIAALLRYEKPVDQPARTIRLAVTSYCALLPDVESVQPRDVNHLLFLYACELVVACQEAEMQSFMQRLVRTLMQRGFDLDTRDAHGNSLLSHAAIAALLTPKAESAFRMLVDLGAEPCRWRSAQGHNLLRVCSDHVVAQLRRLIVVPDTFNFQSSGLLDQLKRVVRLLAAYGVDTAEDAGAPYWKGLAAQTRPFPEAALAPNSHDFPAWMVGEAVLNELLLIHAKDPAAFPARSKQVSLLLHYLASVQSDMLVQLMEVGQSWHRRGDVHIIPIDIHVRDAEGRTLQEVLEQTLPADGPHFSFRFLLAHLAELKRQWMQHERPFLRRQLDEQTDLLPELRDLAMSFVDGLDHRGERAADADAEPAAAADEEDEAVHVAEGEAAAANGEQPVAGL